MSRTKRKSLYDVLNEAFRAALPEAFKAKWDVEVEVMWSFDGLITSRVDEAPLTSEQYEWIAAFEAGYMKAWEVATAAVST